MFIPPPASMRFQLSITCNSKTALSPKVKGKSSCLWVCLPLFDHQFSSAGIWSSNWRIKIKFYRSLVTDKRSTVSADCDKESEIYGLTSALPYIASEAGCITRIWSPSPHARSMACILRQCCCFDQMGSYHAIWTQMILPRDRVEKNPLYMRALVLSSKVPFWTRDPACSVIKAYMLRLAFNKVACCMSDSLDLWEASGTCSTPESLQPQKRHRISDGPLGQQPQCLPLFFCIVKGIILPLLEDVI